MIKTQESKQRDEMKQYLRFFGRLGVDEDEETQQEAERDADGESNDPQ